MKIKTKARILLAISLSMLLLALGFALWATQRVNTLQETQQLSQEILIGVFKLNILRSEYSIYPEERAKEQWFLEYGALENRIRTVEKNLADPQWQEIITEIRDNSDSVKPLFAQLVAIKESDMPQEELESLVKNQLIVKSQETFSNGLKLQEYGDKKLATAIKVRGIYVLFSLLIFTLVMLIVFSLMTNSILKSINQLQTVITEISLGKLDVQINQRLKRSSNEVGELARAFDRTMVSLKLAMVRTAPELQKKMEEQQQKEKEKSEKFKKTFYVLDEKEEKEKKETEKKVKKTFT